MEGIVLTASRSVDTLEKVMSTKATPTDMDCYTAALRRFSEKCFNLGQVRMWAGQIASTNTRTYFTMFPVVILSLDLFKACHLHYVVQSHHLLRYLTKAGGLF